MVGDQLFHIFGRLDREVVAQPRANQNFLHTFECTRTAVHVNERTVIGVEVLTNAWIHTARFATRSFNLGALATDAIHVGRGPTQV